METTSAAGHENGKVQRLQAGDLLESGEHPSQRGSPAVSTPSVPLDRMNPQAGDELLFLHMTLQESLDLLEKAAQTVHQVGVRVAADTDHVARLELFIDRVHTVAPELYDGIVREFGWDEV